MTTELALVLAEDSNPARTAGRVFAWLMMLGLITWGIVHLIRKGSRPRPRAQQPYWDGTA